ncbi:TonB-dependent receptor [Sphingomicrobium lutaoense]|uniref:TonB-dependent receptor n=1 Tax=Sphingomicrobium lutaoense TaxID=515949 RepID=A0A839Z1J9_9SPHN|nr:TonB-dependent receptor [Sphingomicrobium lutaoense]MBB3763593.1 TonB-dependent receptor [Sphingomicrobium lutaoense]
MAIDKEHPETFSAARMLATVSSVALCMAMTQPAHARDTQEAQDEEEVQEGAGTDAPVIEEDDTIVVTGYLQSLENAQAIKRDADTFVDVITAEDIGALPDRSVAESLQRVPGVNISRFEQRDDPDRFSVEGSGVIIRGLPYVRSELNGRDIFSANGGRVLGFNDVSPELLGRVEVYKNLTADMVEGGVAGLVNLVTRKPLDNPGLKIAGTIEANVGDLAEKWSPGFSILASNSFDSGDMEFGIQLGYAQQELVTRTDASQITDPCYRAETLDGPCVRFAPVGSGGYGDVIFGADEFPPANTVVAPKGAGVRTTGLERDRQAYSAVMQMESKDGSVGFTVEYLRAETDASINEFAVLAQVNDDNLFPVIAPGTTPVIDGNQVVSATLTQNSFGISGIPTETLRFQRKDEAMTEDLSGTLQINPTDRLALNFEGQYINSDRSEDGIILAMRSFTDIFFDNSGETPVVQFLQAGQGSTGNATEYLNDPAAIYYWFHLDNQVRNEGKLYSLRADADYDLEDTGLGPVKGVRFGARWSDRNRVTRNANFANWSNLGDTWTGRGGNWNCGDPQIFGCGGAYAFDFPESYDTFNPFGDDFQRGNVAVPVGPAIFFGGDDLVAAYLDRSLEDQLNAIKAFTITPEGRPLIYSRGGLVSGLPFLDGEISDVDEETLAFYGRVDFGHEFAGGVSVDGNFGLRYVETTVGSAGELQAIPAAYVDDPIYEIPGDPTSFNRGGDGDGIAEVSDIQNRCANIPGGQTRPGYCDLSAARQAEFVGALTGEIVDDSADIVYDNWLPSFNIKVDVGGGLLFRGAVSKGIFRPDMAAYRTGGFLGDNTRTLVAEGTTATGPLFSIFTGNRLLRPLESWNYDLSAEYYWADVGSVTMSLFQKDFSKLFGFGPSVRPIDIGASEDVPLLVTGPVNFGEATLKGAELAYQQQYDFLPGALGGFGTQLTYTYVDASDFGSEGDILPGLPFPGVSKHTVNAVLFYEKYGLSARAAYHWRSDFLQTPRDVIFPFSPIYGEETGQLDASIFYSITDNVKIGVQGVNLLDEVTRTTQVIDYDGTRLTRSAFRNDRRFTFLLRFDF